LDKYQKRVFKLEDFTMDDEYNRNINNPCDYRYTRINFEEMLA